MILEIDVRRAAPQSQRGVEESDRFGWFGVGRGLAQAFELVGVEIAEGHVEHVATRHRLQPVDDATQARQFAVQRVHGGGRQPVGPQKVEEEVARDDHVATHQQRGEQTAKLMRGDRVPIDDLDRPENPEPHPISLTKEWRAARTQRGTPPSHARTARARSDRARRGY
jgi:hypothetical protein